MQALKNPAVDKERTRICHIRGKTHKAFEYASGHAGFGSGFRLEKSEKILHYAVHRATKYQPRKNNIHRDVGTDTEIVHGWCQCAGRLAVVNCAEHLIKISSFHVSLFGTSSIVGAAR